MALVQLAFHHRLFPAHDVLHHRCRLDDGLRPQAHCRNVRRQIARGSHRRVQRNAGQPPGTVLLDHPRLPARLHRLLLRHPERHRARHEVPHGRAARPHGHPGRPLRLPGRCQRRRPLLPRPEPREHPGPRHWRSRVQRDEPRLLHTVHRCRFHAHLRFLHR